VPPYTFIRTRDTPPPRRIDSTLTRCRRQNLLGRDANTVFTFAPVFRLPRRLRRRDLPRCSGSAHRAICVRDALLRPAPVTDYHLSTAPRRDARCVLGVAVCCRVARISNNMRTCREKLSVRGGLVPSADSPGARRLDKYIRSYRRRKSKTNNNSDMFSKFS